MYCICKKLHDTISVRLCESASPNILSFMSGTGPIRHTRLPPKLYVICRTQGTKHKKREESTMDAENAVKLLCYYCYDGHWSSYKVDRKAFPGHRGLKKYEISE